MAEVTIQSGFGDQENKVCRCFHFFPIYFPWNDKTGSSFFERWVKKTAFSLSSFTFIKRLFSSSSLSAIKMVSSAYLRLLIFLLTILIPAWASSSLKSCIMYSLYKLNKQGDIYSLDILLFQFWNNSLFHVQF